MQTKVLERMKEKTTETLLLNYSDDRVVIELEKSVAEARNQISELEAKAESLFAQKERQKTEYKTADDLFRAKRGSSKEAVQSAKAAVDATDEAAKDLEAELKFLREDLRNLE